MNHKSCLTLSATAPLLLAICLACSTLMAQEQSVKPGINKSFDKPNVTDFEGRFEKEGREAFDHRKEIVAACQLKPGMAVADVGAGTIYRYFESKEALVNAIYRQEKTKFANVVVGDFPTGLATRELFRTMFMKMAAFTTAHPKSFVFMELHHHAPYLDAESRALEERMSAMFAQIIVAAQGRNELKAGAPRILMGIVLGGFVGVVRGCVEIDIPLEQADWKLAEQCLWEAIRA